MFCTFCGTELPLDASFCSNCGQRVDVAERAVTPEGQATPTIPVTSAPATTDQAVMPAEPIVQAEPVAQPVQPAQPVVQAESVFSPETLNDETLSATTTMPTASIMTATQSTPMAQQKQPMESVQSADQAVSGAAPTVSPVPTASAPAITEPTASAVPAGSPAPAVAVSPSASVSRNELFTEGRLKAMGAAIGIGCAAAVVLVIVQIILFAISGAGQVPSTLGDFAPSSQLSNLPVNLNSDVSPLSFFGILLSTGVGGALSVSGSASSSLIGGVSGNVQVMLPISLSGLALVAGAAFGSYMFGQHLEKMKKWTNALSGVLTGLVVGLVYVLIGYVTAIHTGASTSTGGLAQELGLGEVAQGSATISGASLTTFFMAFLLAGLATWAGFALASNYAGHKTVFHAAWKWAHEARGYVRTVVESSAIYMTVFGAGALIALIVLSIRSTTIAPLMLLPTVLPFFAAVAQVIGSFGTFTAGANTMGQTVEGVNINLIKYSDKVFTSPWLWLAFALFIIASLYIMLRMILRNEYDPSYKDWKYSWQAPAITGGIWLFLSLVGLKCAFSATVSFVSGEAGFFISSWYCILIAAWIFLLEVGSRTLGQALYPLITLMWAAVVGGTVAVADEAAEQSYTTSNIPAADTTAANAGFDGAGVAASVTDSTGSENPTEVFSAQQGEDPTVPIISQPVTNATTPVIQPTMQPQSQPAVTMSAPSISTPMDPRKKRNVIIGAAVAGVVIALIAAFSIVSNTVFSAESVAKTYVEAIEKGNYSEATKLSNLGLSSAQTALLTSTVGKNSEARISGATLGKVTKNADGSQTFPVTYNFQGSPQTGSVTLKPVGKQFGVFNSWKITQGLVQQTTVSLPDSIPSVSIGGVEVGKNNALSASSRQYVYVVYPGVYPVKAAGSKYMKAVSTKVKSGESIQISSEGTQDLKKDIAEQVKSIIDECVKSTSPEPEGCPIDSYIDEDDEDYRNFSWKVISYPEVSEIYLEDGIAYLRGGKVSLSYEEKGWFSDEWDSETSTEYVSSSCHFTIKGNKLTVSFDEDDDY